MDPSHAPPPGPGHVPKPARRPEGHGEVAWALRSSTLRARRVSGLRPRNPLHNRDDLSRGELFSPQMHGIRTGRATRLPRDGDALRVFVFERPAAAAYRDFQDSLHSAISDAGRSLEGSAATTHCDSSSTGVQFSRNRRTMWEWKTENAIARTCNNDHGEVKRPLLDAGTSNSVPHGSTLIFIQE